MKTKSGFGRWIAVILATVVLAGGWFLFGPQIIRIVTDQGEIVIKTDDDNIHVEILEGGKVVRIIDTANGKRANIKTGEYQIKASDSHDPSIQFRISDNTIQISRGGRRVVTIELINSPAKKTDSNAFAAEIPKIQNPEPVYDGRTFDQWLDELSRERSRLAFKKGIDAIGPLAMDDPERQRRALDAITPSIRMNGSSGVTKRGDWSYIFLDFFRQMPPEMVFDFVVEEIDHGSSNSRKQAEWNVFPWTIYPMQPLKQERHQEIMHRSFPRIVDAGCLFIESNPGHVDNQQIRNIMRLTINSVITVDPSKNKKRPLNGDEVNFLEKKLAASHNKEVRGSLAAILIEHASDSSLSMNELAELLGDTSLPDDMTILYFCDKLSLVGSKEFSRMFRSLKQIYESDKLCQILSDDEHFLWLKTIDSLKALIHDEELKGPDRVRFIILFRISESGYVAPITLPWIDRIARGKSVLNKYAADLARKIRGGSASELDDKRRQNEKKAPGALKRQEP